jgi:hypothetical protein
MRKQRKNLGAIALSIGVHLLFFIVATFFVTMQVMTPKETQFEAVPRSPQNMELKKLQVPVELKQSRPKLRIEKKRFISPVANTIVTDTAVIDRLSMRGSSDYGSSALSGVALSLKEVDLFGRNQRGSQREFVGRFYDLKQTKDGDPSEIGRLVSQSRPFDSTDPDAIEATEKYRQILERFLGGWNERILERYFCAPQQKYTTAFVMPIMDANDAPTAFGVGQSVKPSKWLAYYQGEIVAPKTGKYRFHGVGDDVLVVRVKNRVVLDGSIMNASGWQSDDQTDDLFKSYNNLGMRVGDWFSLQEGKPVSMEVLLGEEPGGLFFAQLYVEMEGVSYPTRNEGAAQPRPILPIFKTDKLADEVFEKMKMNPSWATRVGPIFGQ